MLVQCVDIIVVRPFIEPSFRAAKQYVEWPMSKVIVWHATHFFEPIDSTRPPMISGRWSEQEII